MNFIEWGINISDAEDVGEKITNRYRHFGVEFDIKETKLFNNIFKYRIRLSKTSRFCDLQKNAEDVRRGVKLRHLRIVIENSVDIWIIASVDEVKNNINLFNVLNDTGFRQYSNNLALTHPIGVDEMGKIVVKDLSLSPHLLIAGTTGSGKTTAVQSLIVSLLYLYDPNEVNLIIADLAGDLLPFNGFPHLSCPVITDPCQFYIAVIQLFEEMKRRIKLKDTNEFQYLPHIVFIADEFNSLIAGNEPKQKEARRIFQQILRMGRHARIHVVAVAFNPTAKNLQLDVADFPTRMAFKVSKCSNSMAIIGCGGAEKLAGKGEMWFRSSQDCDLQRIQGLYITPDDLARFVEEAKEYWRHDYSIYQFIFCIDLEKYQFPDNILAGESKHELSRNKFSEIAIWALGRSSISTNELMRKLHAGWNKAQKVMAQLEAFGIVSPLESKLPREILPTSIEDLPRELIDNFQCKRLFY